MKTSIIELLEKEFLGKKVRLISDAGKVIREEGVVTDTGIEFDDHHTDIIYFEFDGIFDNRTFLNPDTIIEIIIDIKEEVKNNETHKELLKLLIEKI